MKFHKIRNVDKKICTAEQKIAYNYAFADYEWVMRSDMELHEYLNNVTNRIKNNPDLKKYDIDAIIHCLRNGFINFCKSKYHILHNYESIGKVFFSMYDVEKEW